MVALVGVSGSGKTTIADLMMNLIDAVEGKIKINGIPIDDINKRLLHQQMSYVSQDNIVFNGTLRDNICIRKPDATDKEIWEVLQMVTLDQFVQSLPDGLNSQIGENGIKLSGGQKQRVVFARALIIKPRFLILDEATSHLDVESEMAIQKALESMRHNLTMVVIAHRLSTVQSADLIYVLDQGKIIESGTYDELVKKKGRFYHFATLAEKSNSLEF